MKKSTFINLVVGVIAGLLFSVGMCMCLLPEWNAFDQGAAVAGVGGVALVVQAVTALIRSGKKFKINWRLTGKILFGVLATLVLGLGMCMIMVWNRMTPGIIVGVAGIVLLLCLIPMCVGLK